MALLRNRPLAAASLLLILVIFFSFYLDFTALLIIFCVTSVVLLALVALSLWKKLGHARICVILLMLAVLCGTFRVSLHHLNSVRWEESIERTVSAELCVKEILSASSYGTELLVDVETLDGERTRSRAVVRAESLLPFYVGDRFEGSFTVKSLTYDNYYERAAYNYLSEGAFVILLAKESTITFTESGTSSLAARIADLRAHLSYRMTSACKGEEGRLLSALLLGTRAELSDATVRDFGRAGVSHLLALSGLHLTVLVGILDLVLRLLGRSKRTRMVMVLFCCLLYLLLTGCQYSMIRAVIMLTFVYLAFLWRGDHDAMTALCFSAALMLTVTPTAIFGTSFQMTMLATFGILLLNELTERIVIRLPRRNKLKRYLVRCLYAIPASLAVTLFATFAILPIAWMTFGEISLLTPLSNLLLVLLATPLLLCALLLLILPFPPLAAVLRLPASLALWLVERFSLIDGMISLRYPFLPLVLIPTVVLAVVLLLVDLKRARVLTVAPMLLLVLAFTVCLVSFNAVNGEGVQILYRGEKGGESIVLCEKGEVLLCDNSSGTLTQLKAGWRLAQEECYATELDVLMLTHYHERHVTSLTRFCESVRVRSLMLPAPSDEEETKIYKAIREWAEKNDVACLAYDYDTKISFGESTYLSVSTPLYEDRSIEGALSLSVYHGGRSWCYHSAALSEYERHAGAAHPCAAECVMIGGHGPVPHEAILLTHLPSYVLVSNGEYAYLTERLVGVTYRYDVKFYSYLLE